LKIEIVKITTFTRDTNFRLVGWCSGGVGERAESVMVVRLGYGQGVSVVGRGEGWRAIPLHFWSGRGLGVG